MYIYLNKKHYNIYLQVIEDLRPSVRTKSTLTSASLLRHKEEVKDRLQVIV